MSDYVGAQKIQQELARRLPGDKTINEFSKLLPDEVLAQKQAEAGEAEYDEEYDDEYDDEEYGEDDEVPVESEQQDPNSTSASTMFNKSEVE